MITAVFIICALFTIANLLLELKRDLMMLQQNSYRHERYLGWLRQSGDTTSTTRLIGMAVFLVSLVTWASTDWAMAMMVMYCGANAWMLFRKKYKKPLVWTKRAKRIYGVDILLSIAIMAAGIVFFGLSSFDQAVFTVALCALLAYCGSHIVTLASLAILAPYEKKVNRKFYDDAERILRSRPDLTIIGITGSYGKTSTKHYLHRILSEQFDTLMTPGSYNTTMGVIRTVREMLKPYNEVFIVEMGAKNIGDIKEICDLVRPQMGIITAVGEQHLESFKTIENVQRTKFELVDSLPATGLAVVNNDFPFAANRNVGNVECIHYAVRSKDGANYVAKEIDYTPQGTTFVMSGPDCELELRTRLVGECNISNLMAAVIIARRLGVPDEKIRYAVEQIEQVEHRLNMKVTPAGITIIDDAFNSNPTGSAMALDVLSHMTSGKRIIVTPGMIELGDRQEELNHEFGRKIASCADIAIIVGEYNREAIVSGIKEGGMDSSKIHEAETFKAAQAILAGIMTPGDTVLYENDLPDTFK
ncbi:MAG: UDP-N-acetylmuramoyl-tripeptide--D-alanyl-D-alanine ligase [Muribaculaceae bacterium]|nr:UDP-N-acetylmuramoyl-tripeptide--D-alanyl-D-alanine ligase [Muribaculaceae bacterium]